MMIEMYDELKRKMVSVNPDRVEVVVEKNSDEDVFIMTKIIGKWGDDDVIVYIGNNAETALETRLATELQIKEEEENQKLAEFAEELRMERSIAA